MGRKFQKVVVLCTVLVLLAVQYGVGKEFTTYGIHRMRMGSAVKSCTTEHAEFVRRFACCRQLR